MTQTPWILHFHGVVYIGWISLFILQTVLAARGRIQAHRSVGDIGIGFGFAVLLVGLLVSFAAPVMHVTAGEWTLEQAAAFLPIASRRYSFVKLPLGMTIFWLGIGGSIIGLLS